MYESSSTQLSHGDVQLLKFILAAALYPRVAMPHSDNAVRREQDMRFNTSACADLVVHPGSSLAGALTGMSGQVRGRAREASNHTSSKLLQTI